MLSESLTRQALQRHQEGFLEEAEDLYRKALRTDANNFQVLQLLGTLTLRGKRYHEALDFFERTFSILENRHEKSVRHAVLHHNYGLALQALGRSAEAVEHFLQGLRLNPNLIELHICLGRILMDQGDYQTASSHFETVLGLNPDLPDCLCDLGTAYAKNGRLEDAIVFYRRAIEENPLNRTARMNLAEMLRKVAQYAEAEMLLRELLKEEPDNIDAHRQLGIVSVGAKRYDLAQEHFGRVLASGPDDAKVLHYLADIQKTEGNAEEAKKNYLRSHELQPLTTIAAIKSPPDFRVLLLFSPYAGNTPLDCMVDRVAYDTNIVFLLPDAAYDIDALRDHADVIVNLIADVDQGRAMLSPAAELIDRIGKPTVNHPRKIMPTDRESMAKLLMDVPNCCVPYTCRYSKEDIHVDAGKLASALHHQPMTFPVLVRPSGTHGGEDFEKIHSDAELVGFVEQNVVADFYFTEFVDYRSVDGFFRKYRFIFVNDEILPYHLAIDDKWKVHHASTDMANHPWMQQEERAFLENPHHSFNALQYEALDAIRGKVGLDYFGIDCALDCNGRVVVFEVNACMLVHHRNEQFPYKNTAVQRIKDALYSMLKRKAMQKKH